MHTPSDSIRYELKLPFDQRLLSQVRGWLLTHPAGLVKMFEQRQVNSIYFDTPALSAYTANVAGASQRQKLRLRWYGDITPSTPTWEMKRKSNQIGDKLLDPFSIAIDWSQSWMTILPQLLESLPAEWQMILPPMLRPTVLIRYEREYFATRDGSLRATLDYSIRSFDQLLYFRPNFSRQTPSDHIALIELKAAPDSAERFEAMANQFPIRRSRYSKYAESIVANF